MLVYKASYRYLNEGIHGEVVDFPGVITFGRSIKETRHLLSGALVDMAETNILIGEALPKLNPDLRNPDADFEEPINLILKTSIEVIVSPQALI